MKGYLVTSEVFWWRLLPGMATMATTTIATMLATSTPGTGTAQTGTLGTATSQVMCMAGLTRSAS